MSDAYKTTGTKGSDVYDSTGSSLLDLSVRLVRGAAAGDIRARIREFSGYDSIGSRDRLVDAFVLAFHTRNVRGGKGERDLFYTLFFELYLCHPMEAVRVLHLIPKYGCWRDMFELASYSVNGGWIDAPEEMKAALRDDILKIVATQLRNDARAASGAEPDSPISLCAKWAPREGNLLAPYVARAFVDRVGAVYTVGRSHSLTMRYYRLALSMINKALGTVEVAMTAGKWSSIDPKAVPGRAGALYKRAFLNLPSTWTGGKHTTPAPDGVRCDSEDRKDCAENFAAAAQPGVGFLYGWSPSQYKALCASSPKPLTAVDILRLKLNNPRYDAIREALSGPPESAADFDLARWGGRL